MSLFWLWSSSNNIYKIMKVPWTILERLSNWKTWNSTIRNDAFFSYKHRSCYRQWLPKILGEHHATGYPQGKCGHKRILELLAAKLDLLPFIKGERIGSIHFQTDKKTALSYLVKTGGTGSSTLVRISKENWGISMIKGITITAE